MYQGKRTLQTNKEEQEDEDMTSGVHTTTQHGIHENNKETKQPEKKAYTEKRKKKREQISQIYV